jgi:hypothetical protein
MPVAMATTATVKKYIASLKERGCRIDKDKGGEWYRAWDGDVRVYSALKKGASDVWIVACSDGPRIKWSQDPQFSDAKPS